MEHFYKNIEGWFTYPSLYSDMIKVLPDGARLVEVGVFKGQSLAFLIVEGINSGKDFEIIGVDSYDEKDIDFTGVENAFYENMESVILDFTFIKEKSVDAAREYIPDASCDFVFIDAGHTYEDIKTDIEAWLPKVKKGGFLAGHDYHNGWVGVDKAVAEIFGAKIDQTYANEYCWLVRL